MPRMPGTTTRMFAIVAAWILFTVAAPAASFVEDEPRPVLAASGGRHVFVSMDGGDVTAGFEIMHFDGESGPAAGRIVARVPRRPEAIAAFGDRCWVVLPPFDADNPQREVVSFKVERNPATNLWYASPVGRFEVLPVLPREPRLVGVAGDADGPVAVFLPSQRAARGIDRERDESSMPAEDAAVDDATEKVDDASSPADEEPEADLDGGATFLIGSTNRWKWSVESPPLEFLQVRDAVIGVGGTPEGVRPVMAWTDDRDGDAARLSTWEEGGWRSRSFMPAPATRPLAIVESEGGVLLASRTESGDVLLDYVRPGDGDDLSLLRLGSVAAGVAGPRATVVGVAMGPWIVDADEEGLRIAVVDPLGGSVGEVIRPIDETGEFSLIHFPLTGIAMISALMAALLLRPWIERAAPREPVPGLRPMPLARRIAALCIDMVPGAMVTIVAFDIDPAEFVESFRSGDPETAAPAVFAIVVTAVIAGIGEVFFDRSLGKAIVGGRVTSIDGTRGTAVQRGLRALLKMIVLLLPPLALLVVIDPLGRGMPELLSRTCVTTRERIDPSAAEADSGDQKAD
ncbi:MAG: RDD family protein [Phycisphaeraceae bacterium]|nr:RDD family protein [Phycisphaeraceae bacterium]